MPCGCGESRVNVTDTCLHGTLCTLASCIYQWAAHVLTAVCLPVVLHTVCHCPVAPAGAPPNTNLSHISANSAVQHILRRVLAGGRARAMLPLCG